MENLARYIIRASFSQERMTYIREESKVMNKSNDGWQQKAFDALEWLAAMSSHIPDKGDRMRENRLSGSLRGWEQLMYGCNSVAPPGN